MQDVRRGVRREVGRDRVKEMDRELEEMHAEWRVKDASGWCRQPLPTPSLVVGRPMW